MRRRRRYPRGLPLHGPWFLRGAYAIWRLGSRSDHPCIACECAHSRDRLRRLHRLPHRRGSGRTRPRRAHARPARGRGRTGRETIARRLAGVDTVCHQAAKVGLGVDVSDLPAYASTNVLGTAVLLAGIARAEVDRLVLASSMVVHGEGAYDCRTHGGCARNRVRPPTSPRAASTALRRLRCGTDAGDRR